MKVNIFIGSLGGGGAERVVSEITTSQKSDTSVTLSLISDNSARYSPGNCGFRYI